MNRQPSFLLCLFVLVMIGTSFACAITTCYGISSTSASVCNGHGKCTQLDHCECNSRWYGNECSLTSYISTIAGTGTNGYSGDGGLATSAPLYYPRSISRHPISGEMYFADSGNNIIRKLDRNGNISRVVAVYTPFGQGTFGGDGGLAIDAQMKNPNSLFINSIGEIYIADTNNHRIRKVDVNGAISTIAGDGTPSYGGDDGLAINAQLKTPNCVTVSKNGEIYIADTNNHRIRKIFLNGTITTIAGTGTNAYSGDGGLAINAQLKSPFGVTVNSNGEIYIADTYNHRIRKIDLNGIITTIAGDGTTSIFNGPRSVVLYHNDMYIADSSNHVIRKLALKTGNMTTIAGTGDSNSLGSDGDPMTANFDTPSGLMIHNDVLHVADIGLHRIRAINLPTTCNGILFNDTSVCSGNGECTQTEVCNCNANYYGTYCEIATCFNIPSNDPSVCNGHGSCNMNGKCTCYSNSTIGYWKNDTCNQCQDSYFGKNCWTSLQSQVRFMDDFSGITFTLYGNLQSDSVINCSSIIPSDEMYLYGSNPTCNWIYSSSQFNIKFGQGSLITSQKLIHLNMLVFDSGNDLTPINILQPLNPIKPIESSQKTNPRLDLLGLLALLVLVIIAIIVIVGVIVWCVIKKKKVPPPTTTSTKTPPIELSCN